MRAVPGCGDRILCVEKNVDCKLVDTKRFQTKLAGDPSRLNQASSAYWAQGVLSAVVCTPKNGQCPTDRSECANQPSAEIGCTWRDVDATMGAKVDAQIASSGGRKPASELAEAVVMTGIVKAIDDRSVTVLTQGRTITVPKATVQTVEYAMGQEIFYEVTSQRLIDFFFRPDDMTTARKRGTSSENRKVKRPPNMQRSGAGSEPIQYKSE